jgi:HD superfamily phosphohydrolase
MKIQDSVYGEFEVNEPVLIDLVNSKAVQRLQGISQGGLPERYCTQPVFTRYEHSIGVMLLLRKLGAEIEEQIAGLLHDISHTAFSHLVDWVVGDPNNQSHQDEQYRKVFLNSDVPEILEKHGFIAKDFEDIDSFGLLERESPDLCADRIDYSLRSLVSYGGKKLADEIVKHFTVKEGLIVFDSVSAAYSFSHEFSYLQRYSWSQDSHSSRFSVFATVLKRALELGILNMDDFLESDENVLLKIESSHDLEIVKGLEILKSKIGIRYVSNGIELKGKFRFVDPKIFINGYLKRLSDVVSEYGLFLDGQRAFFKEPKFVEVVKR